MNLRNRYTATHAHKHNPPVKTPGFRPPHKRLWLGLLLACVLAGHALCPLPAAGAEATVRNIHCTYGADPAVSVSVGWRTDAVLAAPKVRFGPADATEATWREVSATSIESAGGFNHHAALEGLLPGTRYRYRVSGPDASWGPACGFKTAPQSGGFTFAVIGDVQGKEEPSAIWGAAGAWLAGREDVDFAVLLGDLVDKGAEQLPWDMFFNPVRPQGAPSLFESKAVMPILGNHDYYGGPDNKQGLKLYLDQFRLPPNGTAEWNGRFYTFPYGDARFVMLDTEDKESLAGQTRWMASLDWNDHPWVIAALHSPVYQFSRHDTSVPGRRVWRPHFFDRHAQLVFNGHNHTLAASRPLRATRLDGLSGGKGFTGPWQAKEDRGSEADLPALLLIEEGDRIAYPGLADTGRAVSTLTIGILKESALNASRPMGTIVPGGGKDLWIGYLFQRKGGWYANSQGGWRLTDRSAPLRFLEISTRRVVSGDGKAEGRFRISAGSQSADSAKPIAAEGREQVPAEPFFVVAKFTFADGKVTGRLKTFRAPETLPTAEPVEWDAVVELPEDWSNAAFDQLVLLGESIRRDSLVDEFRVGRTMRDVIPPTQGSAPPPGALVEECFDIPPTGAGGVVYFDGGGINYNSPPDDAWYVRYGQEKSNMPILGLFTVQADKITGRTVLFRNFEGKQAGDTLDEFEIPRAPR